MPSIANIEVKEYVFTYEYYNILSDMTEDDIESYINNNPQYLSLFNEIDIELLKKLCEELNISSNGITNTFIESSRKKFNSISDNQGKESSGLTGKTKKKKKKRKSKGKKQKRRSKNLKVGGAYKLGSVLVGGSLLIYMLHNLIKEDLALMKIAFKDITNPRDSKNNERRFFRLDITLQGSKSIKSLFFKVSPIIKRYADDKKIKESDFHFIDTTNYEDYGPYIYEANIYNSINEAIHTDSSLQNSVIKIYGYGITKMSDPDFVIKFGEDNNSIVESFQPGTKKSIELSDKIKSKITPILESFKSIYPESNISHDYISYQITEFNSDYIPFSTIKKVMYPSTPSRNYYIDRLDMVNKLSTQLYQKGLAHFDLHGNNHLINKKHLHLSSQANLSQHKLFDFDLSLFKKNDVISNGGVNRHYSSLYKNICGKDDILFFKMGRLYDFYRIYSHNICFALGDCDNLQMISKDKHLTNLIDYFKEIFCDSKKHIDMNYSIKQKINTIKKSKTYQPIFTPQEETILIDKLREMICGTFLFQFSYKKRNGPTERIIISLIWCFLSDEKGDLP